MKLLAKLGLLVFSMVFLGSSSVYANPLNYFSWQEINDGSGISWQPRAGLQALNHRGNFYVMGGRSPKVAPLTFGDSLFYDDVWRSSDQGLSWKKITAAEGAPWAARAYFQAVRKGRYMYVLGGQDSEPVPNVIDPTCQFLPLPPNTPCPQFFLSSNFFNDVWRSKNGKNWQLMTDNAKWRGRAGLSAIHHRGWIYVMGGSVNDDSAIVGAGGPPRIYFNDVYRSRNGRKWQKVTDEAPWAPRAGAVLVKRGKYMYLMGGEDGFQCNEQTPRCPPYYNDVWKSKNGKHWTQVTNNAGWSPRPGHQCEVLLGRFICFGGFGLSDDPADPFKPSNPIDVWASYDAKNWTQLSDTAAPPWNAAGSEDIKYDFAAFPVYFVDGRFNPSIFTFGGDRETFSPFDFNAFLKVDNDVWQFSLYH